MQWLKKIFYQKKTIEEVKQWIKEEQERLDKEQQNAINAAKEEYPQLIINIKQAIVALERAELRNPNIPERAKHFMQGNRDQLLKLTNKFVENLLVPKDAPDMSQLDLLFYQYTQNTARPAAILSEFLGEEVKKIRSELATIETKTNEIKKALAQKEQINRIAEITQNIDKTRIEKETVEKQQEEFKAQLQQLTRKRDVLKKEKEEFTTKPEYQKVKEDIITAAKERQESEQEITGLFLALSDAIKKYAHNTKNEKLSVYAEKPIDALIHDYALGILKHVKSIEDAIKQGQLELKPERTQKAMEALKKITKENLSGMIHRYANAKKRETDVHHDVAQRAVMKEYEQYAVDIKTVNVEIEQLEKTIAKLILPADEQLKEELRTELEKHKITLTL